MYIYTWNLFVLYFGGLTLQNKAFSNQNKGHLGSRYTYIYMVLVPDFLGPAAHVFKRQAFRPRIVKAKTTFGI